MSLTYNVYRLDCFNIRKWPFDVSHVFVLFNPLQSLETLDNGKPFVQALLDMKATCSALRYFAGCADKIVGQTIPVGKAKAASGRLLDSVLNLDNAIEIRVQAG